MMVRLYLIYNEKIGKGYVGQTKNSVRTRWIQHIGHARQGSPSPLHCAMRKYGADSFEISEIGVCTSREQANRFEQSLIVTARENLVAVYNATDGGEGIWNPSPEVRRKMSLHRRGRPKPADYNQRRIAIWLSKSRELCDRIRELYGSGMNAEAVAKVLATTAGRVRARLRWMGLPLRGNDYIYHRGRRHSDEFKQKVREGVLKWWSSPEGQKRKEEMCRQPQAKK